MEKQQTRKQKRAAKFGHASAQKVDKKQKKIHKQKAQIAPEQKKAPKNKGKQQLPTIQDMLQIPKDDRETKTVQYFKKIKPFVQSYMQKKIGSRVIQLMFKWGTPEIKAYIHKTILAHWKDLIKSKYALHAISKVSAEFQFPRLADDAVHLQNHKEGSLLLQIFINTHHGSPKVAQIYGKFEQIAKKYAQNPQKGFESQQILHNLAMKSIEKSYFSNKISKLTIKLALPTMVEQERAKVIQFFAEQALNLLSDDEGVKLFIALYNYFESKQKKDIIKQLKGRVAQVMRMCKISYVALIKIITETDDTVLLGNIIIPQLLGGLTADESQMQNEGEEVQTTPQQNNQRLFNTLISLLCARNNNFNCLGKIEKEVEFTTCKKPEEVRKQQIRNHLYPGLVEYVVRDENITKMCSDPHQYKITLGLIKSMQTDASEHLKGFSSKLLKFFLKDLQSKKQQGSKKISVSQSLAANNFGSKLLKNILLLQQPHVDKFSDKLSQIFKSNLQETLHCNASFVVEALIQKGRTELLDEIKRSKIDLTKVRASDFYQKMLKAKPK